MGKSSAEPGASRPSVVRTGDDPLRGEVVSSSDASRPIPRAPILLAEAQSPRSIAAVSGSVADHIDQQRAVPVAFQTAPATFHRIVFAVVWRIVHEFDFELVLVGELDQPFHKLRAMTLHVGAVVEAPNDSSDVDRCAPKEASHPPGPDATPRESRETCPSLA